MITFKAVSIVRNGRFYDATWLRDLGSLNLWRD
jgi:hypothetical protein